MTDIDAQSSTNFDELREALSEIADSLYKAVKQIATVAKALYTYVPIEDKRLRKIRHLALYGKNRRIRKKNETRFYLLFTKEMEEKQNV